MLTWSREFPAAEAWRRWRRAAAEFGGLEPSLLPTAPPADLHAELARVRALAREVGGSDPAPAAIEFFAESDHCGLRYGSGRTQAWIFFWSDGPDHAEVGVSGPGEALDSVLARADAAGAYPAELAAIREAAAAFSAA